MYKKCQYLLHNFFWLYVNAVKVGWYILFQICALVISDCNSEMLKSVTKAKDIAKI